MNGRSSDATSPTGDNTHDWKATRRRVLAAGGAVGLSGLAGCSTLDGLLDSATDQIVQNKAASPAGFYTGSETLDTSGGLSRSGPVDVRFIPPTLQAGGQRIDIDGWSTSSTTKAQDYNSSRSNKPRSIWVPDPNDDDDDGDGILDGILVAVLDTERALLVYADAAIAAVDEQSSDEATSTLDAFINATTKVRAELEDCSSETCVSVYENADSRKGLAEDAHDAVDAGEWDSARRSIQQARRIVQGDIDDILGVLDSVGDGTPDTYRFDNLEIRGRSATIGERFVVSLPNARGRGDQTTPLLYQRLTPKRYSSTSSANTTPRAVPRATETSRSTVIWPVGTSSPRRSNSTTASTSASLAVSTRRTSDAVSPPSRPPAGPSSPGPPRLRRSQNRCCASPRTARRWCPRISTTGAKRPLSERPT